MVTLYHYKHQKQQKSSNKTTKPFLSITGTLGVGRAMKTRTRTLRTKQKEENYSRPTAAPFVTTTTSSTDLTDL